MGYSDMNKKPFEPLTLVADGYDTVAAFVEGNDELKIIADKTTGFLQGFYSDFALELLSSLDFIIHTQRITAREEIIKKLEEWNNRKRSLFSNPKYVEISLQHLESAGLEHI